MSISFLIELYTILSIPNPTKHRANTSERPLYTVYNTNTLPLDLPIDYSVLYIEWGVYVCLQGTDCIYTYRPLIA